MSYVNVRLCFCCFLGKCFLYCNGLMDHIYVCRNVSACSSWYKTPTHFSGTLVRNEFVYIHAFSHLWFQVLILTNSWCFILLYVRMRLWKSHAMRVSGLCGADFPPHCKFSSEVPVWSSSTFWPTCLCQICFITLNCSKCCPIKSSHLHLFI